MSNTQGAQDTVAEPPATGNTAPAPLSSTNTGPPSTASGPQGAMSFDAVENAWLQAGGSPQAAAMAAAVADAESGLNPNATRTNPDGTTSVGLWLIPQNGTPPGSTDPLANARAALQLSQNGTDWSQWCSAWSDNNCGENGGTYLGSGSNALMSLGQQAEPGQFSTIGAVPAGNGTGASAATSTTPATATGSNKTLILVAAVVLIVVLVVMARRRKRGQPSEETTTETDTQ